MISEIIIPKGAEVLVGAPAKPLSESVVSDILSITGMFPRVAEMHLPHCYVKGVIDPPRQVLFILSEDLQASGDLHEMVQAFENALPQGFNLDIVSLESDSQLLDIVKDSGCAIFKRSAEE